MSIYMNKLCILLILLSIVLTSCGAGKPKGGEGISYFGAAWLNNERIIYTKQAETVRFSYNPIAALGNNTSQLIRTDYFICTMDLNGEDEKILKQFRFVQAGVEGNMPQRYIIEGDKKIKIPEMIRPDSYSCNNDIIVFNSGSIFTMKPDGSELKNIGVKGINTRLSPDGKLILCDYQRALWLVNIDGTGKRFVDSGTHGIWSPDGKRIAYWKNKDYLAIIDSDGQNPVELTRSNYPLDWTPDGSMILVEGGFINILNVESFVKLPKLAALPNYPRLSPDGEKIVGEPIGFDADICVTYMYVTERDKAIKVLKKTHFKKWDN